MKEVPQDKEREERITMEAVVDAYDEEERATGWYYYLEEKLTFPFNAKCISRRMISPLLVGEEVEVLAMEMEESEHEMFVQVRWSGRDFAVPLSQLYPIEPDTQTQAGASDAQGGRRNPGSLFESQAPDVAHALLRLWSAGQ